MGRSSQSTETITVKVTPPSANSQMANADCRRLIALGNDIHELLGKLCVVQGLAHLHNGDDQR